MTKNNNHKINKFRLDDNDDYLLPHIIFNSCCEVLVEGSKGIIEYNTGKVRLNAGSCILNISGDSLCIRNLTVDEVIITGDIISLEFCSV